MSIFLSDKCELTAGSDEKTQRSPAGDRIWVFRLPVGRPDHWVRSHDGNFAWFFCLSPNCQFFSFHYEVTRMSIQQTRRDQRKLAGFSYNSSNRKFVPVGTIPSNPAPSFFLSDKGELTAWSDEKKKKNRAQPCGDRTWVFQLPVGRSDHWATKPRQELRVNFCHSPN